MQNVRKKLRNVGQSIFFFFHFTRDMCKKVAMQNLNNHNNWYTPPKFHGFMPQVQSLQPLYLRSPQPTQQETKTSEETKAKQERWTARQAEVLVSLWVENFEALESSRCNQV